LGFLTIGASIGLMGASAWLITTAALHPSIAVLQVAIVSVRFFGITRGVSRYFERLVSHNLTFKILTRLRVWFYERLVPLAPARLLQYRAGDLLSRIITDIKTLEDFYVRSLYPPLVAVLIGLATGFFFAGYSLTLMALLLGFFVVNGLVLPLLVRKLAQTPGRKLVTIRSQLMEELAGYIQGLPDLLTFGSANRKADQLQELEGTYNQSQLQLARISGLNAGLLIFFSNLAMWLTLIMVVPLVRSGLIPGPMLGALALMVLSAFEAVQPLPQSMETLASSLLAGSRLFEIVDAEPAVSDPSHPAPFPSTIRLEVKDLSFRYPGNLYPALNGVNFSLEEGQVLALVGPSGAGKSTLSRLLLRFWGDYQGEIILGEEAISLERIDQQEVRDHFSVLTQDAYLFHESVRFNIGLGNPLAETGEIIKAAELSQVHQFIQDLPEGYQTLVGERGLRFSGGERQRLNLARTVLKDSPIYLLDEPTANLDPLTERAVLKTLFTILKGKTALLITHRLVGLARVDQILVLDRGRIIERGTEEELLAVKGLYWQMWTQQNRILNYS
jgi:ATP-binding cassette subfamily C protein CydC